MNKQTSRPLKPTDKKPLESALSIAIPFVLIKMFGLDAAAFIAQATFFTRMSIKINIRHKGLEPGNFFFPQDSKKETTDHQCDADSREANIKPAGIFAKLKSWEDAFTWSPKTQARIRHRIDLIAPGLIVISKQRSRSRVNFYRVDLDKLDEILGAKILASVTHKSSNIGGVQADNSSDSPESGQPIATSQCDHLLTADVSTSNSHFINENREVDTLTQRDKDRGEALGSPKLSSFKFGDRLLYDFFVGDENDFLKITNLLIKSFPETTPAEWTRENSHLLGGDTYRALAIYINAPKTFKAQDKSVSKEHWAWDKRDYSKGIGPDGKF